MDLREPRVVVGIAPSLAGLEALRFGVTEARRRQVGLCVVRTWYLHPTYWGAERRWWEARLADEAAQVISDAFDTAMGGVPADLSIAAVVTGERADLALTRIAGGRDDLLVLGGRAGGRLMSWIVRSCIRRACCPVVTVPPPELAAAVHRAALRSLVREVEQFSARTS